MRQSAISVTVLLFVVIAYISCQKSVCDSIDARVGVNNASRIFARFYPQSKAVSADFVDIGFVLCQGDTLGRVSVNSSGEGFILFDHSGTQPIIVSDNPWQDFLSMPSFNDVLRNHAIIDGPDIPIRPIETTVIETSTVVDSTLAPLVSVRWHQRSPFNRYAPNAGLKLAGCTPIAIAQVMAYFRYPDGLSLTFSNHPQDSVQFDWDAMIESSAHNDLDCPACEQKALLTRQVGEACRAHYDSLSTGAWPRVSYLTQLGYTGSQGVDFDMAEIISSLVRRRPCIISAFDDGTPSKGHTWLIDGYNTETTTEIMYNVSVVGRYEFCRNVMTDVYLHFNYGWQTNTDYFALSDRVCVHTGMDVIDGGEVVSHPITAFNHRYNDVRMLVTDIHPIN